MINYGILLKVLQDHCFQIAAVVVALWKWKHLNLFFRAFALQLMLSLFTDALGLALYYTKMVKTTAGLINFYIPLELLLLLGALKHYKYARWLRVLCTVGFGVFLIVWLWQVINDLSIFANYAFIFENILLLACYFYTLYRCVLDEGLHFHNATMWACFGVILFSACIIPYFSVINYLQRFHAELNAKVFLITRICNALNGALITVGLLTYRKADKEQ